MRPQINKYNKPKHINDYPAGPCYNAGNLVTKNAGWRILKPIIDKDKCVSCYICYMVCPEGVIYKTEKVDIDYDFCKGCGICAKECKIHAINMAEED